MPIITDLNRIDITPERFLNACSPSELMELRLLLYSPRYDQEIDSDADAGDIAIQKLSESFKNNSRG